MSSRKNDLADRSQHLTHNKTVSFISMGIPSLDGLPPSCPTSPSVKRPENSEIFTDTPGRNKRETHPIAEFGR